MSRFSDYLASQITPQMTLLEKFNLMIKFLKENNYISIFYSSEVYNPTKSSYEKEQVSTLNYELKIGDCIVFSNGYYAFVETIGEVNFTIGNVLYFQGEQGVSVVSATIKSNGSLELTLSDGNKINAGNTGAVKDFIIDGNQHLIVRYLNGTSNDLGAIFNGDVNISGDFTADSIIENMTGYSGETKEPLIHTPIYAGCVKNGNKLTIVLFTKINFSETPSPAYKTLYSFYIPQSVLNKLYPYPISGINVVANIKVSAFSALTTAVDLYFIVSKYTGQLQLTARNLNALSVDTNYYVRIEQTFLLSENFVE